MDAPRRTLQSRVVSHQPAARLALRMQAVLSLVVAQSPEAQQRVALATESERAAVQLNPQSAEAYRSLASVYSQHRFLRAASEALGHAVALTPADAAARLELGALLRRVGDPEGAKGHFEVSLDLQPSVDAHIQLSFLHATSAERERSVRAAIELEPRNVGAYMRLARMMSEEQRPAEAEEAYRRLAEIDPVEGGLRLYDHLRFADRKLEAAVEFRRAQLRALRAPKTSEAARRANLEEWSEFVERIVGRTTPLAPKCLARSCIEGLEATLAQVDASTYVPEMPQPHVGASVVQMLRAPTPTLLRGGADGWGPNLKWDEAHLLTAAGQEELEVTVVNVDGSFEVRPDRIERPPKSVMRLGDLVRLLGAKVDANMTIYSRQAPLWPMAGLLHDLAPAQPWMDVLRLNDLNIWIGDGHFRNTLHFDPYDNFLCQVRGSKHVLLYPPDAKDGLYYAKRRDIQARFQPMRGEYGRRDTGIVSENTAEINGANPDLEAYPRFADVRKLEQYAALGPSDCLYLPSGWHHHVFSEADPEGGFNLALNLWISREATVAGVPPRPDYRQEPFPTIRQVAKALHEMEQEMQIESENLARDGSGYCST